MLQKFMKANTKIILMLPSVWFLLQLFVFHLVRMVFVTDLAPVSASPGGPAADAEQVNSGALRTGSRASETILCQSLNQC